MGNAVTRLLSFGSARLPYDAIFNMTVAGETVSVLQTSDPTPKQVAALNSDAYHQLLVETRTRKLETLESVMKAKYKEAAANNYAERNSPDEIAKRTKKREELDALTEERLQDTMQNGITTVDEVDWDADWDTRPIGWGRYDETCEEMQEVADRRSRYRAARDGLAKAKAQATADIEAMHRV